MGQGYLARALRAVEISNLNNPTAWLLDMLGGATDTAAGIKVNPKTALNVSAVYACINVISEDVGSLPLPVYRRLTPRGKERAPEHPLYPLLHDAPNPEMGAMDFRSCLQAHVSSWGSGYAEIERDGGGKVTALWPLRPDRMQVKRIKKKLWYIYTLPGGKEVMLRPDQVLHIRGLGFDGIRGYSPITLAREAIALAVATETFGAKFFANNARPGGVLEHPNKMSDKAYDRLKSSWAEQHEGLSNQHRMAILEEGVKLHEVGLPPEDAQFLGTQKFQVRQIARWYRMQPHKIGDLENATFSNIEHQSIEHVVDTIRPWCIRWEQAILQRLFTKAERREFFAEHLVDGLLRGDSVARAEARSKEISSGSMTLNEARELENRNPYDSALGDIPFINAALVPVSIALLGPQGKDKSPAPAPGARARRSTDSRLALRKTFGPLFVDAGGRIMRRERNDVIRAAEEHLMRKRSEADFDAWLVTFYADHPEYVRGQMTPLFRAYAEAVQREAALEVGALEGMNPQLDAFVRDYVDIYAARHVDSSLGQLQALVREATDTGTDLLPMIRERLGDWVETRPGKIAMWETVRSGEAFARESFRSAGVTKLVWRTHGENCPMCSTWNGKVVGIEESFANQGDSFDMGGGNWLSLGSSISHPPGHQGCLPGDSRVASEGISAASKRWHDGDMVVFRTAKGYQLACTPNHPILTPKGWIAAGLLNVGDHVISRCLGQGEAVREADGEYVPTRIEDVAETFGRQSHVTAVPVPTSAEDFHGDGANSKVAVVWANSHLRNGGEPSTFKHGLEDTLRVGDEQAALLTGPRREALLLESLLAASGCDVSSGSLGVSLGEGHLASTDQSGGTVAPDGDSRTHQAAAHDATAYVERVRDSVLRLSAGQVSPDQIIHVERNPFSGHVYNLDSELGFYLAESIVTHNCDCSVEAHQEG